MPFGGKYQLTPTQVMAANHARAERCRPTTASVMAFGFDPYFTEQNPYLGAYLRRDRVRSPSSSPQAATSRPPT